MIDMGIFYPLKIFHLFGFSTWKSSDQKKLTFTKISARKKAPKNILGDLFRVRNQWKMVNYTILKILGEAGKQEILQQMFQKF